MATKGVVYSVQANIAPIDPNTGLFTPVWYLYLISLQTQLTATIQGNDAYVAAISDQSELIFNLQSSISNVLAKIESIPEFSAELTNINTFISSLNSEFYAKNDVNDGEFMLANLINAQSSLISHVYGLYSDQQAQIDDLKDQINSLKSYVNHIEV